MRAVDADRPRPRPCRGQPLGDHVRHALQASHPAWRHFADTVQAEITVRAEARARRHDDAG